MGGDMTRTNLKKALKALKFYADEKNLRNVSANMGNGRYLNDTLIVDRGERAKKTIEEIINDLR